MTPISQMIARKNEIEKVELMIYLYRQTSLRFTLTDSTKNIISADALNKTKKGVQIINCARGGLIDELAIFAALESGHVAGAALDVFEKEPAKENILFKHPNVIVINSFGCFHYRSTGKGGIANC